MTDGPVLVFDVGATRQRAGLTRSDGTLLARSERATPLGEPDEFVAALLNQARELSDSCSRPATAVGLAVAGMVDVDRGVLLEAPNLRLRSVPLGPRLAEALGLPVRLVNDVNAAAWAEARAARCDDLVAVFVGSGVGTGLVCSGSLVEGHVGLAAEGGHVAHREGCIEDYLGGEALARRAGQAGLEADVAMLVQSWRRGDERATAILEDARQALGALVRLLVTLLDPERVVLGGGVIDGCPELLEAARATVEPRPLVPGGPVVRVEGAHLGADAGLLGAALLARSGPTGKDRP